MVFDFVFLWGGSLFLFCFVLFHLFCLPACLFSREKKYGVGGGQVGRIWEFREGKL